MLNTSRDEIQFRKTGKPLDRSIRAALKQAALATVELYAAQAIDLSRVTTKTSVRLGFPKFVQLSGLLKSAKEFDEAYVRDAFLAYATPAAAVEPETYAILMRSTPTSLVPFRPAFSFSIRSGLALMLVALHSAGAITLPFSFNWPGAKKPKGKPVEVAPHVASELLCLVRSVADAGNAEKHVFEAVLTHTRRRTWFASNCTKILLATGWNLPSDISLAELLRLKDANDATNFSRCGRALGFRALVDVLERKYGEHVISVRAWDSALKSPERLTTKTERLLQTSWAPGAEEAFGMQPSTAYPERLMDLKKLPGLEDDFRLMSRVWLKLEAAYLNKVRLERPVSLQRALGYLNLYLFFYLPYWFDAHSNTRLVYPSSPEKLVSGIFVSSLIELEFETPDTFVEFMERYASERGWKHGAGQYYSAFKEIEGFFSFLQQNAKELPGCKGFVQPLSSHDMPASSRKGGTNKRPIPAKELPFFVAYVDALVTYFHVVLEKVVSREISQMDVSAFGAHQLVIDTFAVERLVGFVPCVMYRGQLRRMQFIPNFFDLRTLKLKEGELLSLPTPHGIQHVLIATLTGIRGQHIRWLDVRTFDKLVKDLDRFLSLLLVNTDKVRTEPWTPHVNLRVIEVLRMQRAWRELIDCAAFDEEVLYNRNKKSKWPPIKPLFSDSLDGYPHPESRYERAWARVLLGFQGMLADVGIQTNKPLADLLPLSVSYAAPDRDALLAGYADSKLAYVKLIPKSDITPHSARVAVVSNLITFLPADVIGEYVTGQTEAVVHHYVYVDPDVTLDEQRQQALALHLNNFGVEASGEVGNTAPHPRYTDPSNINSNFAAALKENLGEAIAAYGCVSLVLRDGTKTGTDVLLESRGSDAALNKTEVCPFGNNCPPDVIKELKGLRRCARCWYAVRSVDHLPPVESKIKFELVRLLSLERRLDDVDATKRLSTEEFKQLEAERQYIAFDLACWRAIADILESQRLRLADGADSRRWLVPKPELLAEKLQRVPVRSESAEHLLALLGECIAYQAFDTPEMSAKLDFYRRQILADLGDVREALVSRTPVNVAAETFGLLRTMAQLHKLSYEDFESMLNVDVTKQPLITNRPLEIATSYE